MASWQAWLVVVLTALAQFLFAGNIFGYAFLQLLLESDHVLLSLCPEDEPMCVARQNMFVLLFTLCTVVLFLSSFVAGLLADALGPVWTALTGAAFEAIGLVLLGAAGREDQSMLVAAHVLCALGTTFIFLCIIPLAFIVPKASMGFAMSMTNNAFDASAIVYLVVYQLKEHFKLRRLPLFVGYAVLCLIVMLSLALAWLSGPLQQLRRRQRQEDALADAAPDADASKTATRASSPPLHGKSLRVQVCSSEFLFFSMFFFIDLFISNSYLGLNKSVLENRGDASTGYFYTSLFIAFTPVSCLGAPVIGVILLRFGFMGGYSVIAVCSLIFLTVMVVPSLELQVVAFLVYSCYRSTLYSTHFTFLGHTFGSRTSSSVQGVIAVISSMGQLAMYAFANLVNTYGSGRLTLYYFLPCLVVLVPLNFLLLCFLRRYLQRVPEGDCRAVTAPNGSAPEPVQGPTLSAKDNTSDCGSSGAPAPAHEPSEVWHDASI